VFDWAGQPYFTLINTFVFAPYFASQVAPDPATGQAMWGWALAAAGLGVALLSPLLGAHADRQPDTRPLIASFSLVLVIAATALWCATPGADSLWPILVAAAIGNLCAEALLVLVNAMLPAVSKPGGMGRLGGTAWGIGYAGGLVALALMLIFAVADPGTGRTIAGMEPMFGLDPTNGEGARAAGPFSALWLIVFGWPLFAMMPVILRRMPDKNPKPAPLLTSVWTDIRVLAGQRGPMFRFLIGRMIYQDGLNALLAFGGIYAAGTFGWSTTELGLFGILIILTAVFGSWLGGVCDDRFGPKHTVMASLVGLIITGGLAVSVTQDTIFFVVPVTPGDGGLFASAAERTYLAIALSLGLFTGPVQSPSRTLLVRLAPPEKLTQFFGFYALTGKATAFAAPAAVAAATMISNSQRIGMSVILVFVIVGRWVLRKVPDLRS
jgi:UMF1 family MFS transporter